VTQGSGKGGMSVVQEEDVDGDEGVTDLTASIAVVSQMSDRSRSCVCMKFWRANRYFMVLMSFRFTHDLFC